ncbi:hypothetical protein HRM2_43940 [Desulforapulum autotrophicum HRM2]|uniref:Uncharacterized protein n=1 Tax=Desulforapulum autotrophicum (strain ATCC 43914 / DSM 3382 / VKM B-1955 / HRM2) TaxID=177437 RepID=C0QE29_DESAH|nr:hypothetical protein [Desulforapulum autotrophicum]ACN17450.1 hypothetical protein HRM2_43940 [Desulforapulum autotrophicum HRM2]
MKIKNDSTGDCSGGDILSLNLQYRVEATNEDKWAIGTYQLTGKDPAMIWISRSKIVDLTREQAEVMADKMVSNLRLPFHDPETFISNKIKVYKSFGMGQVHYVFCQEQLGYWISAPPGDGESCCSIF